MKLKITQSRKEVAELVRPKSDWKRPDSHKYRSPSLPESLHSLPDRDSSGKRPHPINRLSQEPGAASIAKLPPGRGTLLIVMTSGKSKGQGTKARMRMGTGNLRA